MKIITDKNNNILFKVSKNITNEQIKDIIEDKIENSKSKFRRSSYKKAIKFIEGLNEIEYHTGFSINLWYDELEGNNTIQIYGDNGLIELNIINLNTIKEL